MKKLYVGNISYQATEQDLTRLFSQYGEVASAVIIRDRETNRSKGFGFVEMSTDEGAREALKNTNGAELDGRRIKVSEAHEQQARTGGGGGSFGGGRGPRR